MANLNLAGITDTLSTIENQSQKLVDALDPLNTLNKSVNGTGKLPFWGSGARSFIRVGGKPVAVATEFRWQVAYSGTAIHTVDTPFPWDIDIGQVAITAVLSKFMDPTKGPESEALFATMAAAVHQPFVEMQVLDALGTSLFFARGIFTGTSGSVARGALNNFSMNFQGVAYQHYVSQFFKPYDSVGGALTGFVGGLKNLASTATGGLL